jgi:hypothetical protein
MLIDEPHIPLAHLEDTLEGEHVTSIVYVSVTVSLVLRRRKKNSMVLVRERTIPTERPPLVGEVIANFCG